MPLVPTAAAAPALLAASPAFALVDDRLNGDGTGLSFGINDPTLGWVMAGVFTTVWAIYFVAQRDETINTDLLGRSWTMMMLVPRSKRPWNEQDR